MNKFITKIVQLLLIVSSLYILLGFLADGKTDPFYLRFTTPKQHSLILGTSRAAQGLIPEVLNKEINRSTFEGDIFNYSFTVLHSPFGEVYYNAIENKLNKKTKNGLFIIAVDPWSISSRTDIDSLRETNLELAKINKFNSNPNYNYLRNAYQKSFFSLILDKINTDDKMILHNDGWLEININVDSSIIQKGAKEKLDHYKKKVLPIYKVSNDRLIYLEKTISLLQRHGKVILVRLPVGNEMLSIENKLAPNFNSIMSKISKKYSLAYIKLKDDNYIYPDGNHLYKESGKIVSKLLADDINNMFLNE